MAGAFRSSPVISFCLVCINIYTSLCVRIWPLRLGLPLYFNSLIREVYEQSNHSKYGDTSDNSNNTYCKDYVHLIATHLTTPFPLYIPLKFPLSLFTTI